MRNNEGLIVKSALARPGDLFDAAVRNIRKYLLRRHLAHWHPISTSPNNQDLELRVADQQRVMRLLFPCRRTNAGVWINADLGTGLRIEPIAWRRWQKGRSDASGFFGVAKKTTAAAARRVRGSRGWSDMINRSKVVVLPMSDRATSDRPLALIVAPRAAIGGSRLY
jgi:hypothetical protein